MQLIDTHCHIDFSVFDENRTELLSNATDAGVSKIVVPGVTAREWPKLLEVTARKTMLFPALGLHPCFMAQHQSSDLLKLECLLEEHLVSAVGEIGLDLFIPEADLEQQLAILCPQLVLAKNYGLPVILHVRKAHDQMLKQLRRLHLPKAGIVHAFSGSRQQAEQYLALGFKLGIGGTITYSRATRLRKLVTELPLSAFVLETDSPDMPLAEYRKEPNKPERVALIAREMAELRGCSVEEVAAVTSENAAAVFSI